MLALLNPRFLIAAAIAAFLCFTHIYAYRKGAANVRTEWNIAKAEADHEARKIEQHRETVMGKARDAATVRSTGIRAGVARVNDADDGLRIALDTAERVAKESTDAAAKSTAAVRGLLDSCRAEYKAVGTEAAGHASDSLMYQQSWPK